MSDTKVDRASRDDLPELMRLLRLMHQEGGMFPLDEDLARMTFERAFNRRGGIIGVIRGDNGQLYGGIFLLIAQFWYTQNSHLEDLFNFVDPEHRRSDYANRLIEFAKECSDTLSIPLFIGVLTNKRMEAKVRLYRRRLGDPAGAFFTHGAHFITEQDNDAQFWRPKHTHGRGKRLKKDEPVLPMIGM